MCVIVFEKFAMKYPGHYPSRPGKKPENTNRGVRVYVNNFVEKAALVFQQLMSVVSSGTMCKIYSLQAEN